MVYVKRMLEKPMDEILARGKSILLLGARQTGKTTLLKRRLKSDLEISLVNPDVRLRYEKNPGVLTAEVEQLKDRVRGPKVPLVLIDEIQKVPPLMDAAQDLIDRKVAAFVLTGSSARKLRRGPAVNLLPGRVVSLKLDPFMFAEMSGENLVSFLLYGALPGIALLESPRQKEMDLESYVKSYLEEEVRAEALVRNLGPFARFLELAAAESGKTVNFRKLSQEIGVSHVTIQSYYEILHDCLIAERVEPLIRGGTRRKLVRADKYLIFDLGVRRAAAQEGIKLPQDTMGRLFEQWVGLELLRCSRLSEEKTRIRFWRDSSGPEVDWVIDQGGLLTPVEVKWTQSPTVSDIKHLAIFLKEYKNSNRGYVVCQTPRPLKLAKNIVAISWRDTDRLIFGGL